jgi:hypothetical protein
MPVSKTRKRKPSTTPRRARQRACMDCGTTRGRDLEYYMLVDPVWARITRPTEGKGELCLRCVEARLGRRLKSRDFLFTPLEMEVRLFLSRAGHAAWDALLEERQINRRIINRNEFNVVKLPYGGRGYFRTKHRLFNQLAAGATTAKEVEQRIVARAARASSPATR